MSLTRLPLPGARTERPTGIHGVGRADAAAEHTAERFAHSRETAGGPGWSFADVPTHADAATETVDVRIGDDGRRLGPEEHALLPPTIDADAVRVHTDAAAADTAVRAGAAAFTVGSHIAFAPGREQRGTEQGRRRLSHELAHVAQHRAGEPAVVGRQPNANATSATTLARLPLDDRKRIRVATEGQVTVPAVDAAFAPRATGGALPGGATVTIDASAGGIPAKGLQIIAWQLTTGSPAALAPNSTITLALNLSAHGGINGLYRFTFHSPPVQGDAAPSARVIVEQLGAATPPSGQAVPAAPEPGKKAPHDPIAAKLAAAGITYGSLTGAQQEALRGAAARVPAAHLALVKGLTVEAGDPPAGEDGHYEGKTHTVTIRTSAFTASDVRFSGGGVALSYASEVILHEIGHAIDDASIRKAMAAFEAAGERQNKTLAANTGVKGTFDLGSRQEAAVKKAEAATKSARDALANTKSRSGSTVTFQGDTPQVDSGGSAADKAFRVASQQDGVAVSAYGTTAWIEAYAEAYALYISSPELLKSLRPATYAHLAKTLPK